jgi:hypothetical protein
MLSGKLAASNSRPHTWTDPAELGRPASFIGEMARSSVRGRGSGRSRGQGRAHASTARGSGKGKKRQAEANSSWQLTKDRLPSNAHIKRRHSQSDGNCVLCHRVEDVPHIFFNCPLAQFAWCCICDLLRVFWNPTSFAELFGILGGGGRFTRP